MGILITGVAGFVGCNLAATLIDKGKIVFGIDNLCRGKKEYLSKILVSKNFFFEEANIDSLSSYRLALLKFQKHMAIQEVWHLAANSDIPEGIEDSNIDFINTYLTTHNTLTLMKELKIKVIAFASSSAIYGDLGNQLLTENVGPLLPISNYGAMKLASEASISAAIENFLDLAYIFRFPNVIGVPATHGVMLDFVRKLKKTPERLEVLGNGTQKKGYLHVEDLIDAMLFIRENSKDKLSVFNIGAGDDGVTVKYIAEQTVASASPSANIQYGTSNKGWVGDVPYFNYSVNKLKELGWKPSLNSAESVCKALKQIIHQESTNS